LGDFGLTNNLCEDCPSFTGQYVADHLSYCTYFYNYEDYSHEPFIPCFNFIEADLLYSSTVWQVIVGKAGSYPYSGTKWTYQSDAYDSCDDALINGVVTLNKVDYMAVLACYGEGPETITIEPA
jgi:hypothetical protein